MTFTLDMARDALRYVSPPMKDFARTRIIEQFEGVGYEDVPGDSGGPTKCGVSLNFVQDFGLAFDLNHDGKVDAEDIKLITEDLATAVFCYFYLTLPGINHLPLALQPEVFDDAVNAGVSNAVRLMQRTINKLRVVNPQWPAVDVDGVLGNQTIVAITMASGAVGDAKLVNTYCDERDASYESIVAAHPVDAKFLKGWKRRADSFRVPDAPAQTAPAAAPQSVPDTTLDAAPVTPAPATEAPQAGLLGNIEGTVARFL